MPIGLVKYRKRGYWRLIIALLAASLVNVAAASAQHAHRPAGKSAKSGVCNEPTLACATKVTPAAAPDGSIWLVFQAAGRILVTGTPDAGQSFSAPVAVTKTPADLDWGPDARPKIAIDPMGRIHVAFAVFRDRQFNGRILHAVSTDGGAGFSEPRPMTDDATSQRFETLAALPDGRMFAAWLDKRNRAPAKSRGESYAGAALAIATLDAAGAAFGPTTIAVDQTCECCRVSVASDDKGRPVALFRGVFSGGVRDHAVATFMPDGRVALQRVSVDDWKTNACPHHGPALSIAPDGTRHAVWFTSGAARKGLFYARAEGAEGAFSAPMAVGNQKQASSRPAVLVAGGQVHLVWKEFDGKATRVVGMVSGDGGRAWSAAKIIATTSADSDHPLLVARGAHVLLSWQTEADGYRLIRLEPGT